MGNDPLLPGLRLRRATARDWRTYRDLRIAALLDSPRAFWTTYAEAADRSEAHWCSRLEWPTWIAEAASSPDAGRPLTPVGVVALWHAPESAADEITLVQMWVAGWARGRGVSDRLISQALQAAHADGWARIVLEVAQDNPRAMACYHRAGFEPTGRRAVMPWDERAVEVEMARDLGGSLAG